MNDGSCLDSSAAGSWSRRAVLWEEIFQARTHSQIFFVTSEQVLDKSSDIRQRFINHFSIPDLLLSKACFNSNGFSGYEPVMDASGVLETYNHWSRFVVKQTYQTLRPKESFVEYHNSSLPIHSNRSVPHGWEWYEIVFFVHWKAPNHTTIICFDTPSHFQDSLLASLSSKGETEEHSNPYSLFTTALYELYSLYNTSVWTMRNHVCSSEAILRQDADYPLLHEIARHNIHVSECLTVAIESLTGIERHLREFATSSDHMDRQHDPTIRALEFQVQLFRGLLLRSESNKARLQNELTLAFNEAAQRESKIQVRIGEEAKNETIAMKVIAVGTMTFLPATFLAAVFSMPFFHVDGDGLLNTSHEIWKYFVLAIPLSTMCLVLWTVWQKRIFKDEMNE